jgi:hypothetical protein
MHRKGCFPPAVEHLACTALSYCRSRLRDRRTPAPFGKIRLCANKINQLVYDLGGARRPCFGRRKYARRESPGQIAAAFHGKIRWPQQVVHCLLFLARKAVFGKSCRPRKRIGWAGPARKQNRFSLQSHFIMLPGRMRDAPPLRSSVCGLLVLHILQKMLKTLLHTKVAPARLPSSLERIETCDVRH